MTNLLALGLAALLSSTAGRPVTAPVQAAPVAPAAVVVATETVTMPGWTAEKAERMYRAMAERCARGDASESTRNHCIAATNLAKNVLRDAGRESDMASLRCAKFASDAACLPATDTAEDRVAGK